MSEAEKPSKSIADRFYEQRRNLIAEAKAKVLPLLTDLFKDFPDLTSYSWIAYTPYFNDGDTCYFNSHHNDDWSFQINDETFGDLENRDKDDCWQAMVFDRVNDILNAMPDEFLQELFGDHVRMVVTKDKIDTEHYEHD